MKKITFGFFMMILPFLSFAQINEDFEGATFPPTTPGNWLVMDNGVNGTPVESWKETTVAANVHSPTKAAFIERENIGNGNTSQDWLITPQITILPNGELKFFTKQTIIGNQGTTYQVRISTDPVQSNQAAYTTIHTWSETTLNTTYNVYEEKIVGLNAYAGQAVYLAFVKINTQTGFAPTGDRWLIDDVQVVQKCLEPTLLGVNAASITPTSATLTWTQSGTVANWEVEVLPTGNTPLGTGVVAGTNTFPYSGLTPGTTYQYYVRAHCSGVNYSQWVGPFSFTTTPAGSICSSPIIFSTPYSHTSNTNIYGDEVDVIQGAGCGATPAGTNYLQGPEVFYSFTPTVSGNISISMTPTAANSSIFVYNGCGNFPGTCLAGVANTAITPRIIQPLAVTAGNTYIIVISASTPTGGVPYTLIVQDFNCTPPANVGITNIGTTTADISWTNPTAATSWEIAIQTAGSPIPSGSGVQTNINTNYPATGLTAATAYQYWVRADCGAGVFSPWAGPYTFNTNICNASDRCNYIFRTRDSFGDGWNNARMEVRQNGIVVATIVGPVDADNLNPIDFIVPLCQNYPFELHWTVPGSFPAEVGVEVINNFAQTLYTKPFATGSAPSLLYTASFDCATPACLPPTVTAATAITTNGATLNWTSPGATMWDVYLVPTGQTAPTAASVPTYNDVTTNTYPVTGLNALTTYQYYVRVVCSGTSNSIWAGPISFTTLPTCPQPINLTVTGAGLTTATLGWTETGTATQWEVFIQAPGAGVPTGTGILTSSTSFLATGLTSSTNYEFYVRAICSPTDMSTFAGPFTFKTAICDPVNQCNYTFTMRDSFGDSWNGNTMTVTQNGIVVATLTGPTDADNLNPISVVVPMCTNLPFELFWNAGGGFPGEVGVSVTNQAAVIIYNKPFNTGAQNSLLYADVVECTPLPCGRPITLGANTVTQTTANLTWVQPGGPGTASSWEVIVQPIPLGYPTGAGILTTTNSYPATGLTAASSYEFYVRTNCGADGFSNWSGPFVFNTPVANDECINAIVVIANDDTSCTHNASGSVIGATASLPATSPVCAGTANDDVWFQFTAIGPKHYIAFSNISGGGDLNHAIYTGTSCATMTQLSCQNGTGVTQGSVINGLTIGNTYYIRVWTATATPNQTTTFNICIGTVSTCESADAFCSDPTNPFIFPNTVNVPSEGAQSCLGTNPNPTYYFMSVLTPGNLNFQIVQNTAFDAGGNPTGTGLDVDFIAWGPFASNTAACGNLIPANQVGCSYSAAPIENFNITGALAGQVYVVVITNFNNGAGFIKFGQTNQGQPGAGTTDCSIVCEVDLGPDQNLCGVSSVILDSQLVNAAATYRWYKFPDYTTVIGTSQTLTVTQSGTYRCVGICGPNDVEDTVVINLGPSVIISDPVDYAICDDATNDGIATFDLSTITPTILAGLDTNYTYNVGYYYTEADALLGNANTINPAVPYLGGTQTIYIRVSAVGSPQCNTILVQNLVVKPSPVATLVSSDPDNTVCSDATTATLTVMPTNFVNTNATYVWTLNTAVLPTETNYFITPVASGTYEVTINLNGCTSTLSAVFTVNTLPAFTLSGTNLVKCVNETAVINVVPSNFAVTDPLITYTWTHDTVLMPAETSSTLSTLEYGTFEVTVNNQGCSTTHSVVVALDTAEIPINASAECVGSTYIITSAPINGSFDTTPGAVTYEWFNENDLTTNIGDNSPKFNVTEYLGSNASVTLPVTIVVKITTNPDGCTDTQTFKVLNASCIIQKGISPNGDGDNEEFDLTGLGVKQLSIFNRYGSKVYSLANYTKEWKGQSDKGETLPDGTYYYVIDQTSGEVKTGWIYINK